jgi:uncharacterized RDD family membrane protein YckC
MRVGLFRRIASFLLDAVPILVTLSLLFSLFVGDLLKEDGYDDLIVEYQSIVDDYNATIDPYLQQFENDEITEDEYLALIQDDYDQFIEDTNIHTQAMLSYFVRGFFYHFIGFIVIYYAYNLIFKGNTYGRQIMKIELGGKITWWTIFVREIVYKVMFWLITLFIGGILIDMAVIAFSKRGKAPRDFVSNTYIKHKGVDYPF